MALMIPPGGLVRRCPCQLHCPSCHHAVLSPLVTDLEVSVGCCGRAVCFTSDGRFSQLLHGPVTALTMADPKYKAAVARGGKANASLRYHSYSFLANDAGVQAALRCTSRGDLARLPSCVMDGIRLAFPPDEGAGGIRGTRA